MATITDFEAWLEDANPDDHEEIYALYCTVRDGKSCAWYSCSWSKDEVRLFIKGSHAEDALMLSTEKARNAFLALLERKYCDNDLSMEGWYEFKRSMAKDD